jgi:hypothetical protein
VVRRRSLGGVPVTLSRAWDPSRPGGRRPGGHPEAGVPRQPHWCDGAARRVGAPCRCLDDERLTARRFLSLVTARWADPVVAEPPDVLIAPRLGRMNALQFGRIGPAIAIGERDTVAALGGIGSSRKRQMATHGV